MALFAQWSALKTKWKSEEIKGTRPKEEKFNHKENVNPPQFHTHTLRVCGNNIFVPWICRPLFLVSSNMRDVQKIYNYGNFCM